MEKILLNINEFVKQPNFKDEMNKYFDIIYFDGDFEIKPKEHVEIIYTPEPETIIDRSYPFSRIQTRSIKKFGGGIFGGAKNILIEAERKERFSSFKQHKKQRPSAKIVVVEGDSWAQYPMVKDIVDYLQFDHRFAVLSFARAGDHLLHMLEAKEYPKLLNSISSENPEIFILSAGGNDLLGDVARFLYEGSEISKKDPIADDFLQENYFKLIQSLKIGYIKMINDVISRHSKINKIIIHGYDYPLPCYKKSCSWFGNWLGNPMRKKGIDDKYHPMIIKKFIDDLYMILFDVSTSSLYKNKIEIIDLRGTVKNWFDEIHPNAESNQKLAQIFIASMLN